MLSVNVYKADVISYVTVKKKLFFHCFVHYFWILIKLYQYLQDTVLDFFANCQTKVTVPNRP